jgi:hypothetical protein
MYLNLPFEGKETDMALRTPSLWNYLERHLARRENSAHLALLREQLDKSELMMWMVHIADKVNKRARKLVIDVQSYLPPEPLVRSFSFRKGDKEYILQLESWGPNPTLVFLMRNWSSPLALNAFGWIYCLFGLDQCGIGVKFTWPLQAEEVTEADVEKWFIYLISGFERAFVPYPSGFSVSRRITRQFTRERWQRKSG